VFDVFTWVQAGLTGKIPADAPPTLEALFDLNTRQARRSAQRAGAWTHLTPRILTFKRLLSNMDRAGSFADLAARMHECGFTLAILQTLPEAVAVPLQDAIYRCQPHPPMNWSSALLKFVDRSDISLALEPSKGHSSHSTATVAPTHQATVDYKFLCEHELHEAVEDGDGLERQAVVHALFADRRLNEAQTMLTTSKPRTIRLNPSPQWTEPQYLENQKDLVATVANESLAVPPGRGLLYYALKFPLLTQKFQIGGFVLNCRVKPTDVMVGVDKSLFTEDKVNWAFFHQGVAAGLAISPEAKGIDTSWILYNKPAQELTNRHAGFLLALGLNGHLKSVAKWVAFKYLTPKHTMTSIGLLLGLAISYIGTMDGLITRLLSVHVTRMLPRGAADLNLSHQVQTTGVMGIGLLYCGSQHRRMSEIMLSEIAFTGDSDDEDPLRGEGYRLAAGFALGLINLGKGGDLKGLRDMRLTEQLLTIATATKKVELVHVLDRSAAAAVIAVTLIFMKTEDGIVARKIDVPDSLLQFDYVRPDILLLRTVAKNLILWRRITPTREWIKQTLPREYQWRHTLSNTTTLQAKDLAFFSILTGLCWSISLRYAGSADPAVRDLLLHYLDQFARIASLPSPSDSSKAMGTGDSFDASLARANARLCLDTLALSAATVMAGTGDLAVMRRLRALHGRTDADVTYGSHMAAHLAVGVLFLGCGTATFGNGERSVASLLMAFYPIWPGSVQDCGAHLQAFRHFWVLAVEERCVVARERGGGVVRVPLMVTMKAQTGHTGRGGQSKTGKQVEAAVEDGDAVDEASVRRMTTPHLLPPLDEIASIRTEAASLGFWDLELDFEAHPELRDDFRRGHCTLWLKRRPVGREGNTFEGTMRALGSGGLERRTQAGGSSLDAGLRASGNDSGRASTEEALQWIFGLPAFAELSLAERAMVLDCMSASGSSGGEGEAGNKGGAVDARLVLEAGLDGWDRSRVLGMRLLFAWGEARARHRGSQEQGVTGPANPDIARDASEDETGWWMRDGVIETLKGKALAASREE
jgi:anaphase-promoting complex subunit 1